MFSTTLPLLPPPPTSLLPPLHTLTHETGAQYASSLYPGGPHQQRRTKHLHQSRSSSTHLLSLDERTIAQRKLAIAMYGYSWLKPAGCTKTMLGRREEELEREEVERQLREVEMQERIAAEGEAEAEAERQADLRRLELEAEAGGQPVERNLDDDIPEAEEDESEADDHNEEDDMDGDLDDDIPDADAAGESSWVYDTTRDSDTDSEENNANGPRSSAETRAMANAMLDEDELGERDRHNPDEDMDMMEEGGDEVEEEQRDLDDDVPEADNDDEWQHTDTELEESDMDISIYPVDPQGGSNIGPGTTHEEMRRTSGNITMPPPPLPPPDQQPRPGRNITPHLARAQYHTPGMDTTDSVSHLISSDISTGLDASTSDPQRNRRPWMTSAGGARRNLFGMFTTRDGTGSNASFSTITSRTDGGSGSGFTPELASHANPSQMSNTSSGGLFTPSPRGEMSVPPSRTRSGRVPGAGRGRSAR